MDRSGILVTGTTRVIFMIGTPVAQARSPFLFNRQFADIGENRIMVPLDVSQAALPSFISMVRDAANCDGFVATLPHKRDLLSLVDEASETARALESVNVVRREPDGRLAGDMTDGAGYWNGAASIGFEPRGKSIALAGAGAAGTAIAHEFAKRGGGRLAVWSRSEAEIMLLQTKLATLGVTVEVGMPPHLGEFDMAINATPVGMAHAPGSPFSKALIDTLPPTAIVADAITEPLETELLKTARQRGLRTLDGQAMTAGQFSSLLAAL